MKIVKCRQKYIITFALDIKGIIFNRWTLLILFLCSTLCAYYYLKSDLVNFNKVNFYYLVSTVSLIYVAIVAAYDFQVRRNERKLDYAIKLVEKFDSEELRQVRDFTRIIKKHKPNISDNELLNYLNPLHSNTVKDLMKKYGYTINKNDINFERELVFLFNYWQQVYLSIELGYADTKYIAHCLKDVFDSQYDRFKIWIEQNIKNNDAKQYNDLLNFRNMCISKLF